MTYVLIHGVCFGGWCWKPLVKLLHKKNHNVYTPTLSGMGERSHLLSPKLTLQTHIDDIINVIKYEELNDVILVGHSYAGLVIAGVNEAIPEKIAKLVFLDAYIPENGKTGFEIIEKKYTDEWQLNAQSSGQGWLNPATATSLDIWGIDEPPIRKLMINKITAWSTNFLKTPVFLSDCFYKAEKVYIRCTKPSYVSELMLPYYQQAISENWKTYQIDTGHAPMLTKPELLFELLSQISID